MKRSSTAGNSIRELYLLDKVYFDFEGGFMKQVLEQVKEDLIKLRAMLPMNDHRSKGLIKRINWAISAILKVDDESNRAEVVL